MLPPFGNIEVGGLPGQHHKFFRVFAPLFPFHHLITLKDFKALCDKEGIEILEVKAESRHLLGRILMAVGLKNLGASRIVARIRRRR